MRVLLRSRFRHCSERSAKFAESDHEATVSQFFQDYVDCGKPGYYGYIVRRPRKCLGALIALFRLPCLYVAPSAVGEGAAIRATLSPRSAALLSPRATLVRVFGLTTSALRLPLEPGQYSLGRPKQALRTNARHARRLGVCWAEVSDPQERQELLKLSQEHRRFHPNVKYRKLNPNISEAAHLLSYRLWLVAYSAEGRPLLLSVTPVDGEVAIVAHFATIGSGEEQSRARYLMAEVLVEHLVGRGVRYLVDGGWPAVPNGIRYFQRLLGFRIVRIRVARAGRLEPGTVHDSSGIIRTGGRQHHPYQTDPTLTGS